VRVCACAPASRGRSSSTSCARRWTMTSTCRNSGERRGQRRAPPNICSSDLVCGSRRYCGTGVRVLRVCRYACNTRTLPAARTPRVYQENDHRAISAFRGSRRLRIARTRHPVRCPLVRRPRERGAAAAAAGTEGWGGEPRGCGGGVGWGNQRGRKASMDAYAIVEIRVHPV